MKKIFAIALAVVMVLSMASAFASVCASPLAWSQTKVNACGRGSVEVVPVVKVNDGCGGFEYQINECAAAVADDPVYYAVKLTVEANPDTEWWAKAALKFSYKELTNASTANFAYAAGDFTKGMNATTKVTTAGIDMDNTKEAVYYLKADGLFIDAADAAFDFQTVVHNAVAGNPKKAKVCATLTSDGKAFTEGVVGEYYVTYEKAVDAVAATKATLVADIAAVTGAVQNVKVAEFNSGAPVDGWIVEMIGDKVVATAPEAGKLDYEPILIDGNTVVTTTFTNGVNAAAGSVSAITVYSKKGGDWLVWYGIENDKVFDIEWNWAACGNNYAAIKAFMNLEVSDTITDAMVQATLGWESKQEDCATWNADAVALVSPNCVVAIPKTGDASVLAWLF